MRAANRLTKRRRSGTIDTRETCFCLVFQLQRMNGRLYRAVMDVVRTTATLPAVIAASR